GRGPADRGRERVEQERLEYDTSEPAPRELATDDAGRNSIVLDVLEQRHDGRVHPGRLLRMRGHQLLSELGERKRPLLLSRFLGSRMAQPVVLDHEAMKTFERAMFVSDSFSKVLGSRPNGLLEDRQEQLLLPAEVLVEGPEGLSGRRKDV